MVFFISCLSPSIIESCYPRICRAEMINYQFKMFTPNQYSGVYQAHKTLFCRYLGGKIFELGKSHPPRRIQQMKYDDLGRKNLMVI